MGVDVTTEIVIHRPIADVAAYAADPTNAPQWYANIRSVDLKTPPPLAQGSQIAFVATFLGRTLSYTYEVVELVGGDRLTMRTADGPCPMVTTYTWTALNPDQTRMTLRNTGTPTGFATVATPLIASSMRRTITKIWPRYDKFSNTADQPSSLSNDDEARQRSPRRSSPGRVR